MFDRFRSHKPFRYSRWDGTQRLDDLDPESVLDALSDDYLKHGDLRRALERLMQQGFKGRDGSQRMGMQELMERLRQMRQQRLQRYNLDGVMDDILQKLEHIKQLEREGIYQRMEQAGLQPPRPEPGESQDGDGSEQSSQQPQAGEDGQQGQPQMGQQSRRSSGQQGQSGNSKGSRDNRGSPVNQASKADRANLDNQAKVAHQRAWTTMRSSACWRTSPIASWTISISCRSDPAGQIKSLSEYDFMDEQARQEFQELLAQMQQQIMQQYFQGMQQAHPEHDARRRDAHA